MTKTALLPPPPSAPPENWKEGLTGREVEFVDHYAVWRNATQAYTHAYDTNGLYDTRRVEGQRLLKKPHIAKAIDRRIRVAQDITGASVGWLFNRFLQIANADPRELIGLKVGCCRFCYGVDHQYQWREGEYMERVAEVEAQARLYPDKAAALTWPDYAGGFGYNATHPPRPDCPRCHGEGLERFVPRDTDKLSDQAVLLYGGVKVKKDGYEIIVADRSKALELAGRVLGAFNDKVKISGAVGHLHAIADLRAVDPQQAAAAYREFVQGHLTG